MTLDLLLKNLDLFDKDELYYTDNIDRGYSPYLSNRTKESLLKINPAAFFCINHEPLILFFDKGRLSENFQKQVWNFNQSPAIFIQENNQWVIKNGFNFLKDRKNLALITDEISDFEYFKIITGQTWQTYKDHFENKHRVDYFLLNNIETARNILIKEKLPSKIANTLIGRVLFMRYLIDRAVELDQQYKIHSKEDFYTLLEDPKKSYTLFNRIREDFNGNLFPLEHSIDGKTIQEKELVKQTHLKTIISLLKGDKLSYRGTQTSLFDIYDFSIIPIEFISNIYEKFIGVENQSKQGAYYTPLFLVDYIQKQTVRKYFQDRPKEYNCKVLDPACGSGIFLVETLRQIISQYQKTHPNYNQEENSTTYKEQLKQLLKDNIFGIDKDQEAIRVTVFSLYITLLDYLEPKRIIGFQFPELIGSNFFIDDFFDLDASFNNELKNHPFQYILGNPPWKTKHPREEQPFEKYIEYRKNNEENSLEIENREIAEAFLIRVSDFDFCECSLVAASKILYKVSRRKKARKGIFRNYFLEKFNLHQVFELSSVRRQVFNTSNDKAIAPATVLFYSKKSEGIKNNIVTHISLKPNVFFDSFKLMVIEKYDIKEIAQEFLIKNDWLWKVLVYGNILDYYFIKRLKSNTTVDKYLSNKKEFIHGNGICIGKKGKTPVVAHKEIASGIDSRNGGLNPYYIKYSENFLEDLDYVHRPRKIELFQSPVLLIGKGIDRLFRVKSAISNRDAVYKDATIGIKPLTDKSKDLIKLFLALFQSELFRYYLTVTGSSVGIEREKIFDKDVFSFPIIEPENLECLAKKVEHIERLAAKSVELDINDARKQRLRIEINKEEKELNKEILDIYGLSKQEIDLLNYTNTITIPLLKGTDDEKKKILRKLDYRSAELQNYAQIFISHFGNRFNSNHHYFEVEIIYSNHTILMKFKIISNPSEAENCIIWIEKEDKALLNNITNLSFENLSHHLYIQKDVKGFEEDFFYIAKPNEYKVWHPSIANLDLLEFIEAFHKQDN